MSIFERIKPYCPYCGGDIIGDGYTIVLHCENVDVPLDIEPDADIIYCNPCHGCVHFKEKYINSFSRCTNNKVSPEHLIKICEGNVQCEYKKGGE